MKKYYLIASYLVTAILLLFLAFMSGAWMVRHIEAGGDRFSESIKAVVVQIATAPGLLKTALQEVSSAITGRPDMLLISKSKVMKADWKHQFPSPSDDGYLLLSGVSPQEKQSIVQLLRIADGQVLAKWVPNWKAIHSEAVSHRFNQMGGLGTYRAMHPVLLSDGSLIFNTNNTLVRQALCTNSPTWVLPYPYHHSVELSDGGHSVWVPTVTESFYSSSINLQTALRDDGLAEVGLDGKLLQKLSFSKILHDNGMTAQMLGSSGFNLNTDPIHINQITPATTSTAHWKRGDLLISARHLSTVYLYRPSSGKIVWHQQGPWLNQHSAHFHKDKSIVVFGNNVYGQHKIKDPFVYLEKHNQVYLHDLGNQVTSIVQRQAMAALFASTLTEGRAKLQEDMSLFIEETNNGRIFKIASDGSLQWSYLNTYDESNLGAVSWSRYLSRKELLDTLPLESLRCQ